ncbi:MAG TPA: hypothetical protein PK402_04300 [Tepidisphaeraceae bacterium]|nr:hypothetical protein [Tepidisphaeraceae bacterium]
MFAHWPANHPAQFGALDLWLVPQPEPGRFDFFGCDPAHGLDQISNHDPKFEDADVQLDAWIEFDQALAVRANVSGPRAFVAFELPLSFFTLTRGLALLVLFDTMVSDGE